ncbi:AbrB family transcriptional regulator [Limisalsivibrio acetivorans]|uniref:AbrB family transcriptional regulator n=1 Tax=Limisalsivibrio acetivorans TaxID=1304888 RepID=UPI0003B72AAF|nr:AbrB family transcriptional regulator [Limisalsivibrio acetivorans]
MERLVIIIVMGIIGGVLADKYHIPGGAVVGAMAGSGVCSILISPGIAMPSSVNTTIQILLGISLGITFQPSFVKMIPKVLPIAVLSTLILLIVAVAMSYLAKRFGLMDFGTALFGFSPGGMSGMAIIAKEEGLQTSVVAFLHVVRIFTLFVVVPIIVRLLFVKTPD